jgi:hypothetical protein
MEPAKFSERQIALIVREAEVGTAPDVLTAQQWRAIASRAINPTDCYVTSKFAALLDAQNVRAQ